MGFFAVLAASLFAVFLFTVFGGYSLLLWCQQSLWMIVPPAVVLGRVVKGTIVLVEAGTVPQDCVQKCRDALLAVGANLLGAVLTDYDPKKI